MRQFSKGVRVEELRKKGHHDFGVTLLPLTRWARYVRLYTWQLFSARRTSEKVILRVRVYPMGVLPVLAMRSNRSYLADL